MSPFCIYYIKSTKGRNIIIKFHVITISFTITQLIQYVCLSHLLILLQQYRVRKRICHPWPSLRGDSYSWLCNKRTLKTKVRSFLVPLLQIFLLNKQFCLCSKKRTANPKMVPKHVYLRGTFIAEPRVFSQSPFIITLFKK